MPQCRQYTELKQSVRSEELCPTCGSYKKISNSSSNIRSLIFINRVKSQGQHFQGQVPDRVYLIPRRLDWTNQSTLNCLGWNLSGSERIR